MLATKGRDIRTVMRSARALLLAMVLGSGAIRAQELDVPSAQGPMRSATQPVAELSIVTGLSAGGRIDGFKDSRGREFAVTYDEAGLVSTVRSPGRRNRADLLGITYTADGKLVSVALGDGNALLFSYEESGVQYVRDRYGAILRRAARPGGYVILSVQDPSNMLATTVARLDDLLKALSGSQPLG